MDGASPPFSAAASASWRRMVASCSAAIAASASPSRAGAPPAATVEVGADGEAALVKLRLGLEWFLNPDHMPFVVADKLGFFKEQGLDVELVAPRCAWNTW